MKILVSYGFGAGWSTWADSRHKQFALTDPGLIEMAEADADEDTVAAYIKAKLGDDAYFYTGGWSGVEVVDIPAGIKFQVVEYDGAESVVEYDDSDWTVAT